MTALYKEQHYQTQANTGDTKDVSDVEDGLIPFNKKFKHLFSNDKKQKYISLFVVYRTFFVSTWSLVNFIFLLFWLDASISEYNPQVIQAIQNYPSDCLRNVMSVNGSVESIDLICLPPTNYDQKQTYCRFDAQSCQLQSSGPFDDQCRQWQQLFGFVQCQTADVSLTCIPYIDPAGFWNRDATNSFTDEANIFYPNQQDLRCNITSSAVISTINSRVRRIFRGRPQLFNVSTQTTAASSMYMTPNTVTLNFQALYVAIVVLCVISIFKEAVKFAILASAQYIQILQYPRIYILANNSIVHPFFIMASEWHRDMIKVMFLGTLQERSSRPSNQLISPQRRFIAAFQIAFDFFGDRFAQFLCVFYVTLVTHLQINIARYIKLTFSAFGTAFSLYVMIRAIIYWRQRSYTKTMKQDESGDELQIIESAQVL